MVAQVPSEKCKFCGVEWTGKTTRFLHSETPQIVVAWFITMKEEERVSSHENFLDRRRLSPQLPSLPLSQFFRTHALTIIIISYSLCLPHQVSRVISPFGTSYIGRDGGTYWEFFPAFEKRSCGDHIPVYVLV